MISIRVRVRRELDVANPRLTAGCPKSQDRIDEWRRNFERSLASRTNDEGQGRVTYQPLATAIKRPLESGPWKIEQREVAAEVSDSA